MSSDWTKIPNYGWELLAPTTLRVGQRDVPFEIVLARFADRTFGEIYRGLDKLGNQSLDDSSLSPRLRGVLRRWKGLYWQPYVSVTPRQFLQRSGAGPLTVLEFMEMAAAEVGGAAAEIPSDVDGPGS